MRATYNGEPLKVARRGENGCPARAAVVPSNSRKPQHLFCEVCASTIPCKRQNRTFAFCPLRFMESVKEEGEFAAFINMCAKTNAAKREKPTSRKGVGFSLKSRKKVLSAQNFFREIFQNNCNTSTSTAKPSSRINPTVWMTASTLRLTGLPRIHSMRVKTTFDPSSAGMGRRLKTARFTPI